MKTYKVIVEKHEDGYIAYPLGLKGAVLGQGEGFAVKKHAVIRR